MKAEIVAGSSSQSSQHLTFHAAISRKPAIKCRPLAGKRDAFV